MLDNTGLSQAITKSGLASAGVSLRGYFAPYLVIDYNFTDNLLDSKGAANATLTRASIATYVNYQTGLLTTAIANGTRFEQSGLLIEQTATNKLLYSADLNNAAWTYVNATNTNSQISPTGGATGFKLSAVANGAAVVYQQAASTGNSLGFWAKAGNVSHISIAGFNGGIGGALVYYNSDLVLTNDWIYYTYPANSAIDTFTVFLNMGGIFGSASAGDYIYCYAPQIQDTANCTSTILTTSAAVTRSADTLAGSATNLPVSTQAQTISMMIKTINLPASSKVLFQPTGEINPRSISLNQNGDIEATYGTDLMMTDDLQAAVGNTTHIILTYNGTNAYLYVNGEQINISVASPQSGSITGLTLAGQNYVNIQRFQVYNTYVAPSQIGWL